MPPKLKVVETSSQQPKWRDRLAIHPAAELFPLMSKEELRTLADDIKQNGLRVPIVVLGEGNLTLLDGRNRLDALEQLGWELFLPDGTLKQKLHGPDEDPQWHIRNAQPHHHLQMSEQLIREEITGLNINRRHLNPEQKRELTEKILKDDPTKSDRAIGKFVKRDHKTVAADRAKLEARGEIPHVETHTDTKGREQPATRKTGETRVSSKPPPPLPAVPVPVHMPPASSPAPPVPPQPAPQPAAPVYNADGLLTLPEPSPLQQSIWFDNFIKNAKAWADDINDYAGGSRKLPRLDKNDREYALTAMNDMAAAAERLISRLRRTKA